MRLKARKNAVLALAAIAGLATYARTANAQLPISDLHPSFYGSAEVDSHHTQFYLVGMYVGMGGLGWSPYFNVNAYNLHYRFNSVVTSDSTLSAISPTIGLAYAGRNQGVSIGGGYTWVDHEDAGAPGAEGGGSTGATISLGAYNNGTGKRPTHMQLLSNYNFDSKYVWARGRISVPFGKSSKHPARVGAEVVGQGGGKDPLTSNSFQVGPTFEYGWNPQFRTTAAAGYKSIGGARFPSRESAGYLKVEFSFSP